MYLCSILSWARRGKTQQWNQENKQWNKRYDWKKEYPGGKKDCKHLPWMLSHTQLHYLIVVTFLLLEQYFQEYAASWRPQEPDELGPEGTGGMAGRISS